MSSLFRFRSFISEGNFYFNSLRNCSYVLIPEVPPDDEKTNPVMCTKHIPKYSQINADNIISGCAKLAINFDTGFGKHQKTLQDHSQAKTFDSVFHPIENLIVPLNHGQNISRQLSNSIMKEDFPTAFKRVYPQIERSKSERWLSEPLYNSIKEVKTEANLSEQETTLINLYLREFKLAGISLSTVEKDKYFSILRNLIKSQDIFRKNVIFSHNKFKHTIHNIGLISDLPTYVLYNMAENKMNPSQGPWTAKLDKHVYYPFLEYCNHRMTRFNIWHAFNNRAAGNSESLQPNHLVIKEIRLQRKELAKRVGYENFAEMTLETKMAKNVDNVMNMVNNFKNKFKPLADDEIKSLQDFASSQGFNDSLEMWDIAYWRRLQRESFYGINQADLSNYFPFPKVLNELIAVCESLFDIQIKQLTDTTDNWHLDVQLYEITDSNSMEVCGYFYVDPYNRSDKIFSSWANPCQDKSDVSETLPISYLNLSITPPFQNRPGLMTMNEVEQLFYQFGSCLQQILTTVSYSEISGQNNIETDAVHITSFLFTNILFTKPILNRLNSHWETGTKLSDIEMNNIILDHKHMCGFDTVRELYFSTFDIEMSLSMEHWYQSMKRVWTHFIPVNIHEEDNHPCSMINIFTESQASCYFAKKWSEMIAADIFESFQNVGFDDLTSLSVIGKRYRNTFLALGGSVKANEVFRRFRGRDPSHDAYIRKYIQSS